MNRTKQQYFMKCSVLLFYFIAGLESNPICSLESIALLQTIKKNTDMNTYDGELYMPIMNNPNCSNSTLNCFVEEINVLLFETNRTPQRVLEGLRRHYNMTHAQIHSCPQCEVYKKVNASMFLDTFKNTLKKMCS